MIEEGWGEIVMTLFFVFFQHLQPPSFARPAHQITLEMGGTFWFGFGVVAWCTLGRIGVHQLVLQLAEGLTDNWYALKTCLWGFRLVEIGFGVCL